MPRRDTPTAVRIYTVCDESKFLIVRNVPALGCGDELLKLFSSHGEVEDIKPMDAEECDQYTDVYWIKFSLIVNARFAKKKLDEYVFYGNQLKVTYAPQFESVEDVKEKLEGRTKEVLARLNPRRSFKAPRVHDQSCLKQSDLQTSVSLPKDQTQFQQVISHGPWDVGNTYAEKSQKTNAVTSVSFDEDYFPLESMNQTVRLVREKLNKIQASTEPATKRTKPDNRRRI